MQTNDQFCPEVLLLASRFDLSCDYVVARLRSGGASYFRLNTEDFGDFSIVARPNESTIVLETADLSVLLHPEFLRSIYFRRAVYPREPSNAGKSADEQLNRTHRSAFMRSFMVFDSCKWMNHPVATYKAEHKAVQLATANKLGFNLPRTVITNHARGVQQVADCDQTVAVKGLDTVLFWRDGFETFGYTNLLETEFVKRSHLSSAPLIVQEALIDKLDLRVTVIGNQVYCAAISKGGEPIRGDWRVEKLCAEFNNYDLPLSIADNCRRLARTLGLEFAAIDLAVKGAKYYFLEVNPTGEWGWLMDQGDFPIDIAIADSLLRGA